MRRLTYLAACVVLVSLMAVSVMLPLFLLAGVLKPRLARKALSLSTVGLARLSLQVERALARAHAHPAAQLGLRLLRAQELAL